MDLHQARRRRARGKWMRLRDPQLLAKYMDARDFGCARLGRYAGCSRQFIWQLLNDPAKKTCTPEVGRRIEEALSVIEGTLFVDSKSSGAQHSIARRATGRKAT